MAKKKVSDNSWLNRLKTVFSIATVKTQSLEPTVYPGELNKKTGTVKPVRFTDELKKLHDYWLRDVFDTSDSLNNRIERYRQLKYCYYNNAIVSKTVNLIRDEVANPESQEAVVGIEAKDTKVKKYIIDFFHKVGVDNKSINDLAYSLSLLGDSFWITPTDKGEGILEIIPTDSESVKERIEFNPIEVAKKINKRTKLASFLSKDSVLIALKKMMDDSNEYTKHFKKYLFGYRIEKDIYLPPWNVVHFRTFTNESEFSPFGRPLLINSIAPFKQLQTGKNLMSLMRVASFPTKIFKVITDESMTEAEKWQVIQEAKEEYHDLGVETSEQQQFVLNSEIWVPDDLINFDTFEPRIDMDKIADVEMLRDDLIMSVPIPKGYLIVDRGGWGGSSAQALLRQHKPFARTVYSIQSSILEGLSQMIRLQFVMTGDYDKDTAFELTMPFPETEESSDRLRIKSDSLRLAKDVIDSIGQAVGLDRGEALPAKVVRKIFSQLSFLSKEDVDEWVKAIEKEKEEKQPEGGFFEIKESKLKEINEMLGEEDGRLIKECYFKAKEDNNFVEGVFNQRHFYSSFAIGPDERRLLMLIELDCNKKLEESEKTKSE
jgi:hypothetical protein